MAYQLANFDIGTVTASANLAAYQYHFVYVSGDNTVTFVASEGAAYLGILQNAPASGEAAVVRVQGISKLVTGTGDLAANAIVQSADDGTGITASNADYASCVTLVGAAAGENATVVIGGPAVTQINPA
jgi:hypothetical protein